LPIYDYLLIKNIVKNINITEQLNKFKNLINAKSGEVISEQTMDIPNDVGRLKRQFDAPNTNETDVVNTLKKYKTKKDFQNLVSQYEKIVGTKIGGPFRNALDPSNDSKEWNDLKTHLGTIGITLNQAYRQGDDNTVFGGLNTPATSNDPAVREQSWKTTFICATQQPGAKAYKLKDGTTAYNVGGIFYYNNGRKKLADGTMGNYSCTTEFKSNKRRNNGLAQRFAKSTQLLGIQNGKMDVDTLQKILTSLEGTTPKVKTANDFSPQGVPVDAYNQQAPPNDTPTGATPSPFVQA
jgi:hypothetical protein